MIDIVQESKDAPLTLSKQEDVGECRNECKALQQACKKVLKGKDDMLVSLLSEQVEPEQIQKQMCEKPCSKKVPKLDDWSDEDFAVAATMPEPLDEFKAFADKEVGGVCGPARV